MQTEKQIKGKRGEQLAAEYLSQKGYSILEQNWQIGHLEVDIIASNETMLVFVEVKTRKSNAFGEPEEFVGIAKQRNLIKAANIYSSKTNITKEVRFDIVSVILDEGISSIKHIEDAFKPRW
ncbi:MAG: YraN family protein [Bacteroidales bacterium]|nr:YraN family protein [Bacteroidales bacterium]